MYDEFIPSPNYGYPRGTKGRNGQKIIGVCVHISGAEYPSNIAWMTKPGASAAYTVLVKRDGKTVQLVDEGNAQWAHGKVNKPTWPLLKPGVNPNLYALAISRVGSDQRKWDPPQMDTIVRIIRAWSKKYGFPAAWPHVFGHKHIDSVGRWYCPGDPFLEELYKRLAAAEEPAPVTPEPGIPAGLMVILRQLYEYLKTLFKEE
jgi:N-acetylmuramoyl-L-alanine amidase